MPEMFNDFVHPPTDMQPVKGIKVGSEDITVSIDTQPGQVHFKCQQAKATLFVVVHLFIDPAKLYIPPCASAQTYLMTTSYEHLQFGSQLNESLDDGNKDENRNRNAKQRDFIAFTDSKGISQLKLPLAQYEFNTIPLAPAKRTDIKAKNNGLVTAGPHEEKAQLLVTDGVNPTNKADRIVNVVKPTVLTASIFATDNTYVIDCLSGLSLCKMILLLYVFF